MADALTYLQNRVLELEAEVVKLRYESTHDPLTNLLNRRGLYEAVAKLDSSFRTVALVDLNFLKRINDSQGHAAGDSFIKSVSQEIELLSPNSLVSRWGGDEILIVGNTLAKTCEDYSIGFAVWAPPDHLDEAIKIADENCYIAKGDRARSR